MAETFLEPADLPSPSRPRARRRVLRQELSRLAQLYAQLAAELGEGVDPEAPPHWDGDPTTDPRSRSAIAQGVVRTQGKHWIGQPGCTLSPLQRAAQLGLRGEQLVVFLSQHAPHFADPGPLPKRGKSEREQLKAAQLFEQLHGFTPVPATGEPWQQVCDPEGLRKGRATFEQLAVEQLRTAPPQIQGAFKKTAGFLSDCGKQEAHALLDWLRTKAIGHSVATGTVWEQRRADFVRVYHAALYALHTLDKERRAAIGDPILMLPHIDEIGHSTLLRAYQRVALLKETLIAKYAIDGPRALETFGYWTVVESYANLRRRIADGAVKVSDRGHCAASLAASLGQHLFLRSSHFTHSRTAQSIEDWLAAHSSSGQPQLCFSQLRRVFRKAGYLRSTRSFRESDPRIGEKLTAHNGRQAKLAAMERRRKKPTRKT